MSIRALKQVRIYALLQRLHLQCEVEYEVTFWIGILGAMLKHALGFAFLWVLFGHVQSLSGWSLWELAFLYALVLVPYGLVEVLGDGQWDLPDLINSGKLDVLLLRPLPLSLQVVTERASIHGLGTAGVGAVLMVQAWWRLGSRWGLGDVAYLVLTLSSSVLLIGSLNLLTHCVSFWEPTRSPLSLLVQNLSELGKYPLSLYERPLQRLLTWVLPWALVSYYPALFLLDKPGPARWLGYVAPMSGPLVAALTALVWRVSVRRYEGAGS